MTRVKLDTDNPSDKGDFECAVQNHLANLDPLIIKALDAIPQSEHYLFALSGGLDSIALLFFAYPVLKSRRCLIDVVHIHHDLSPNADAWAAFCIESSKLLGLTCRVEKVQVTLDGEGLEAGARKARYRVFKRLLQEGGVLLQGHHLNDQAETVLMRVLKGLGPDALKGIPQSRSLGRGEIFRPFLTLPRALIEEAARQADFRWIEDESNTNQHFERNYLRHTVIPLLSERQPAILRNLQSLAQKSEQNHAFIQEWCAGVQAKVQSQRYLEFDALDLNEFLQLSECQQSAFLRFWLNGLNKPQPSEACFQQIFSELIKARIDSSARVSWSGSQLRVFDETLFCLDEFTSESAEFDDVIVNVASLHEVVRLDFLGAEFIIRELADSEVRQSNRLDTNDSCLHKTVVLHLPIQVETLVIKARKGSEKLYLVNAHSTSLKKLYQREKVLPWLRPLYPLIFVDNQLIASLAGFVAQDYQEKVQKSSQNEQSIAQFRQIICTIRLP